MTKEITLKNKEIYDIYNLLKNSFNDNTKYLPAKVNFCIQKTIKSLYNTVESIEIARQEIAIHYGTLSEDSADTYLIPLENREKANKELLELMNVSTEVRFTTILFKDIENLEFTSNQMEALMFMIEEEEEVE